MSNSTVRLSERVKNYYIRVGRSRVREVLLRYDDRLLRDLGFSRHALEQGVEAWPWREDNLDSSGASKIGARQDNHESLEKQSYAESDFHAGIGVCDADVARSKVALSESDKVAPVSEHLPTDVKRNAA